ncbi:hypothetical protein KAU39_00530 [bacterium]|nr:hypothetical protein [bacterium]
MLQFEQFSVKILFCTSEPDEKMLLWSFLPDGVILDTVGTGEETLERFKENQYSLILFDTQIGEKDEFLVAKKIREHEFISDLKAMPIVGIISSKEKEISSEFNDYLFRPFQQEEVFKLITKYISLPSSLGKVITADIDIKDFVPEFLANRKTDSLLIIDNLKKNNFVKIKELGHKMVGSGKLYGFERISKIGYLLEREAKNEEAGPIEKLSRELITYLNQVEVR